MIPTQTAAAAELAVGGIGSDPALGYPLRILDGGSPVARNALLVIDTNVCTRGLTFARSEVNTLALCRMLVAGWVRGFALRQDHSVAPQLHAAGLRCQYLGQLEMLAPGVAALDPTAWLFGRAAGGRSTVG